MSKQRHRIIIVLWALALVLATALFWNRLHRGSGNAPPAVAASKNLDPSPSQAGRLDSPYAPSSATPLQEALKAANPGYNGRGQFVQKDGVVSIADLSKTGVTDLSPLRGLPLEALDVSGNPLSDLSPVKGMPLRRLGLEDTQVADLGPLAGLPLAELYLNNAPVRDLSPLKGVPLQVLNLYGTAVEDLTPLAGMPLKSLWLNGTRVKDITPLGGCPLVSLTLENTPVADLAPLVGSPLERLHIGRSAVIDLTPIQGLRLTRLIFTPTRIRQGLVVARSMATLREIGTTLDGRTTPERFWTLYDHGQLR